MKIKLAAALVAGLSIACATALSIAPGAAQEEEAKGSVLVETQAPKLGTLADTLTAYGTALPALDGGMTLSLPVEGRVVRILATPGEAVHEGQALLEFHWSAAAASAYAQAATALKIAQEQQARIARLLDQQLATREQKMQADKSVADAQASFAALERETGGKPQQMLTAPFDGIVAAIPVNQGERVAAGAALATITRRNGLIVTCGIEPSEVKRLKIGQGVRIVPLSGDAEAVAGKLARIDASLDPKTHLIDADVVVDAQLIQGEAFRVRIEVGEFKGWLVPRDAVLDDDAGSYLFQVAGNEAKRVEVQRLGVDDDTAAVAGALDPKLEIVVVGNHQLEDGGEVRKQKVAAENQKDHDADDQKK